MTAPARTTGLDTALMHLLAWRAGVAPRLGKRNGAALERILDGLAELADYYSHTETQLIAAQRRGDRAVEAVHMLHDQFHDHAFITCLAEPCRHITKHPGDALRGPAPLHLPLVPEDTP